MDSTEKLLKQIIPPIERPDGRDREWFSNEKILSNLNEKELKAVEEGLIKMLEADDDYLIAETLIHLNAVNSVSAMLNRLRQADSPAGKIKWASFIFEIKNGDEEMVNIAFQEFEKFEFIYEVESIIFYDLIKFNSAKINSLIERFVNHKYFLVAHHAKFVLNYKGYVELYE